VVAKFGLNFFGQSQLNFDKKKLDQNFETTFAQ
jgi:hypothetical protein